MDADRVQIDGGDPGDAPGVSSEPVDAARLTRSPEGAHGLEVAPGSSPPGLKRLARYPNAYAWFVFLAALDVMLTYMTLHPVLFFRDARMIESRGREANAVANWFIERWDVPGMVAFKFTLVVVVVLLCEFIGRRRAETGRRLAEWAVAITVIPVVVALIQMGFDLYFWFHPRP